MNSVVPTQHGVPLWKQVPPHHPEADTPFPPPRIPSTSLVRNSGERGHIRGAVILLSAITRLSFRDRCG